MTHRGRAQGHPATLDIVIAQHHGVSDEGLVSQSEHVRHHTHRRGYFRSFAHLGPHEPQPCWRKHRGINRMQCVQAVVLDLVD